MKNQMSRRSFVAVAAASLAAMGALSGCKSDPAPQTGDEKDENPLGLIEPGKLTIGSDCDYPPFIAMDGEQPYGFEYDLLTEICKEMGLELNFLAPQKFDTLVASVAAGGKMDLAVSSITITDDRREEVDFCEPYFDSNQSLTVADGDAFKSSADLEGKTIAAQSGTTGEAWVKENIKDATIMPFDDASSAFTALQAGKCDAVAVDLPVAVELIKVAYPDFVLLEEIATGEQYGFAVSKGNQALEDAVNEALQAVRDAGVYQDIYDEYFAL